MTSHEKHACLRMIILGSGCDSVGRAVASDTRGLQFESSHRQILYYLYTVNCIGKVKIKKERPGMAHFLKKRIIISFIPFKSLE